MDARIQWGGKWDRPSFNFSESPNRTYTDSQVSSMILESIRNLLESCQMLSCDLAQLIKRHEDLLRKIERNTRKKKRGRSPKDC
jgi:hypothetical protein